MFIEYLAGYRCFSDLVYSCRRPPIIYDQNEVKQWLQARKKNYPTSVNVNKVNVYINVFYLDLSNSMWTWKDRLLTADILTQKLTQSQLDDQKKDEDAQMRRQVSHTSFVIHIFLSLYFKGEGNWLL
jgi:hypothetical protein